MTRRLIATLLLTLMMLPAATAQLAVGTWRQVPVFGEFSEMADTPDALWYVTGGCLYRYDKDADETRYFRCGTDLSDFSIKLLRYCEAGDFVVVAYENGNMDMVSGDGTRYNLPEIKDAIINVDKSVNDITFDGTDMYVATGFGLVIYDMKRREVRESGIYDIPMGAVVLTPTHIVLQKQEWDNEWKYRFYALPRGGSIRKFDDYTDVGYLYFQIVSSARLDEEGSFYAQIYGTHPGTIRFNDNGTFKCTEHLCRDITASAVSRDKEGTVRFISNDGRLMHFTADGTIATDGDLGEGFSGNMMGANAGLKSFWLAGPDGLGRYSYDAGSGKLTVQSDKSVRKDAVTFATVNGMRPSGDSDRFYIFTRGMASHSPDGSGDFLDTRLRLNSVSRDEVINIDPTDVPAITAEGISRQKKNGNYILSPTRVVEDPDHPGRVYVGSGLEGLYVIENGEVALKIDGTNSPMCMFVNWIYAVTDVSIDVAGNLWVCNRGTEATDNVMILPAAKRRTDDLSRLSSDDWIPVNYSKINIMERESFTLHCTESDMIIIFDSKNGSGFTAVKHGGMPGNPERFQTVHLTGYTDQDGKSYQPIQTVCAVEDHRGQVWFGTTTGVIALTNPRSALSSGGVTVNRVKVPRSDGSGLADYLLESDKITCMAVDASNRKWIGTVGSGLFLVSEDGDRIISTFNSDNSMLPTNYITSLYVDPQSNSVFVGTVSGLFEYSSTSSPSRPDYSDVYAYPNPVTPGYTGWITIAGLMENSLVKIMDSNMHLVYQTVSEGGMAMWDGCTMQGARVRSGVYYVLASSSDDGGQTSAGDVVAKIMVVN